MDEADLADIEALENSARFQERKRRHAQMTRVLLTIGFSSFGALVALMVAAPGLLGQVVLMGSVTLGMLLALAVTILVVVAIAVFVHGVNTRLDPPRNMGGPPQ